MAINLNHQTAAQFAARLREWWRNSTREECARIAWWIIERINAGDVTDAQLRNAFGLTVAQYNTLKTKWTNLRTAYNAVQAAAGE